PGLKGYTTSLRDRIRRLRPRSLGIQARITLAFALGAMVLSAILAGTTFALTRTNLLSQRESNALSRVYVDADVVQNALPGADPNHIQAQFLPSLQIPSGSKPLLHLLGPDKWFFSPTGALKDETVIPQALRDTVGQGHAARMTFSLQGEPALAVGVPIKSV